MSDSILTVDSKGFVHYDSVRLPVRLEGGALEFVIRDKRQWAEHGKRVKVPLKKFEGLEPHAPQSTRYRGAGRECRAMQRAVKVKKLTKKTKV